MYNIKKEEAKLLITSLEACMINTDRDSASTIIIKCDTMCDNMNTFVINNGTNNPISKNLIISANRCISIIDLVYGRYAKELKKHSVQDRKLRFFIKDADRKLNNLSAAATFAEIRANAIRQIKKKSAGIQAYKEIVYALKGESDENIMRLIGESINDILDGMIKMGRAYSR